MPQFFYKAKTGPQAVVTGYVQADDLAQAVSKLTNAGQVPLEVRPQEAGARPSSTASAAGGRVPLKVSGPALFQFTRQLGDLLEAGVPLLRCVELCSRQKRFPSLNPVIAGLRVSLKEGLSFSRALEKYPGIFPPLYINAVRAGEATGRLPVVVDRLAGFLEQDLQTASRIKMSLLYPGVILCVGVLAIFVLLSFVLPRLTGMFDEFDAALPPLTQAVIALSGLFAAFWWLIGLAAAGGVFALKKFLDSAGGRAWLDGVSLKVPVLKGFIENTQLARFARTLGMLLESGVPVAPALELVAFSVDNSLLQREVKLVAIKVREGTGLAQAIKASGFFPEVAVDLIAVGQETGRLEKGLYKLGEGCERESRELAQLFVTILGPAVLVVVVGIVGLLIVAVLLPMFQINSIIN